MQMSLLSHLCALNVLDSPGQSAIGVTINIYKLNRSFLCFFTCTVHYCAGLLMIVAQEVFFFINSPFPSYTLCSLLRKVIDDYCAHAIKKRCATINIYVYCCALKSLGVWLRNCQITFSSGALLRNIFNSVKHWVRVPLSCTVQTIKIRKQWSFLFFLPWSARQFRLAAIPLCN